MSLIWSTAVRLEQLRGRSVGDHRAKGGKGIMDDLRSDRAMKVTGAGGWEKGGGGRRALQVQGTSRPSDRSYPVLMGQTQAGWLDVHTTAILTGAFRYGLPVESAGESCKVKLVSALVWHSSLKS